MDVAHFSTGEDGVAVEGRTRLAIGAAATVAASIAVVCAVAVTNSVALADSPATSVTAPRITIPSSGHTPSTRPLADAGQQAPTPAPIAVTVEAPAPEILNAGGEDTSPPADPPAEIIESTDGVVPGLPVVPPEKADVPVLPGTVGVPPGTVEVPPEKSDAPAPGTEGRHQQRSGGGIGSQVPSDGDRQRFGRSHGKKASSELPAKSAPPGQAKKDDRSRDSSERRDR